MARPEGFEPPTYGFEARRSIQLSYGRVVIRSLSLALPRSVQRVPGEAEIFHHPSADEVFLDDALRVLGCHEAIPRAVGIDEGGRPVRADPQAVRLRPVARSVG